MLPMRSPFFMKWSIVPAKKTKMTHPVATSPRLDALYLRLLLLILKKACIIKQFTLMAKQLPIPVNHFPAPALCSSKAALTGLGVFNELKKAIKMRHYSPKTLKTYSGCTRKFQAYTKSKDSRLVLVDDVKAFLTWLAVDQGVSASSRNQAFNATK